MPRVFVSLINILAADVQSSWKINCYLHKGLEMLRPCRVLV